MLESLTGENEMSEDDQSPTYNRCTMRGVTWGRSHVEAYGHYIKLLYLQGIETNGLMQCFSEAFNIPEPRQDDGDSDESIPEETHPNRWTERVLAT